MEKAHILVCEPSDFLRLFIRRSLEGTNFIIANEVSNAEEAARLVDLDRKRDIDLVVVSAHLGTKAAKHIVDHLSRVGSPAKTLGIYETKRLYNQRIKVTSEISQDDVVNSSSNLRDLISQL
jgi:hypothetical protein